MISARFLSRSRIVCSRLLFIALTSTIATMLCGCLGLSQKASEAFLASRQAWGLAIITKACSGEYAEEDVCAQADPASAPAMKAVIDSICPLPLEPASEALCSVILKDFEEIYDGPDG